MTLSAYASNDELAERPLVQTVEASLDGASCTDTVANSGRNLEGWRSMTTNERHKGGTDNDTGTGEHLAETSRRIC
jgi:hypothetical protein